MRKGLLKGLFVVFILMLLTGCSDLERARGLSGEGVLLRGFKITETEYFREVWRGRTAHCAEILSELNKKAEEVKEENKIEHTDTETNEDGTTTESTWYEYPDVEVIAPKPPIAPAMAYLQIIDENILGGKKYVFNETAILNFYNQVKGDIIVEGSGMSFSVRVEYFPVSGADEEETMTSKLFPLSMTEYRQIRSYFKDSVALYESFLSAEGIDLDGNESGYTDEGAADYIGNIVFDETLGGQVSAWAASKVGCAYDQGNRFGASSFDCSSLVYRAYKAFNVDISNNGATTAAEEARRLVDAGCQIGFEQLAPGDLIFYSTGTNGRYKNITHVSMYIGSEKIVHARNKKYGVRVDPVTYCKNNIRVIVRPSGLLR